MRYNLILVSLLRIRCALREIGNLGGKREKEKKTPIPKPIVINTTFSIIWFGAFLRSFEMDVSPPS